MHSTAAPALPSTRSRTRRRSVGALLAIVLLTLAAAGCMSADAKTFLTRTNTLRSSVGAPALKENDTLTKKAQAWAQHMAATGTLQHSNLTDGLSSLRWRVLGENVGTMSASSNQLLALHNAFVNSPHHRANLVDKRFTHMGVGVARDKTGRVWVSEVFAAL